MGAFTNSRTTTVLASAAALVVCGLNILLLVLAAGVEIPGLD
jgi:Mn2+/Fe2+ NRAMP family transporter